MVMRPENRNAHFRNFPSIRPDEMLPARYLQTALRMVPFASRRRLYWGHNRIEDLYMASDAWHQLQPQRKLGCPPRRAARACANSAISEPCHVARAINLARTRTLLSSN